MISAPGCSQYVTIGGAQSTSIHADGRERQALVPGRKGMGRGGAGGGVQPARRCCHREVLHEGTSFAGSALYFTRRRSHPAASPSHPSSLRAEAVAVLRSLSDICGPSRGKRWGWGRTARQVAIRSILLTMKVSRQRGTSFLCCSCYTAKRLSLEGNHKQPSLPRLHFRTNLRIIRRNMSQYFLFRHLYCPCSGHGCLYYLSPGLGRG